MAETFLAMCWVNRFRPHENGTTTPRGRSAGSSNPPAHTPKNPAVTNPSQNSAETQQPHIQHARSPRLCRGLREQRQLAEWVFPSLRRGGLGCSELAVA